MYFLPIILPCILWPRATGINGRYYIRFRKYVHYALGQTSATYPHTEVSMRHRTVHSTGKSPGFPTSQFWSNGSMQGRTQEHKDTSHVLATTPWRPYMSSRDIYISSPVRRTQLVLMLTLWNRLKPPLVFVVYSVLELFIFQRRSL